MKNAEIVFWALFSLFIVLGFTNAGFWLLAIGAILNFVFGWISYMVFFRKKNKDLGKRKFAMAGLILALILSLITGFVLIWYGCMIILSNPPEFLQFIKK